MSQFGGVERPGPWETAGDHERRIRSLEATPNCCDDPCSSAPEPFDELVLASPCLVAYWPLQDTSGDAVDAAPGGYDLAPVGTPTYAQPGPMDDLAILFEGSGSGSGDDNFFLSEAALSADTGTGRSVEAWVYPTAYPAVAALFIQMLQGTTYAVYQMQLRPDGEVFWQNENTLQVESGATVLALNTWNHVVGTFSTTDGSRIYINGELAGTDASTAALDAGGTFRMGGAPNAAGTWRYYNGRLAHVAVYSCALTEDEVAEHYRSGVGSTPAGWVLTADGEGGCEWVEPGPIDSTENVGLPWGVQSIEADGTLEPEGNLLTADGAGGSTWSPLSIVLPGGEYEALVASLTGLVAYWPLNDDNGTDPLADVSGSGHHMQRTQGAEADLVYEVAFSSMSDRGVRFPYEQTTGSNVSSQNGNGPRLVNADDINNGYPNWQDGATSWAISAWIRIRETGFLSTAARTCGIVSSTREIVSRRQGWTLGIRRSTSGAPLDHNKLVWWHGATSGIQINNIFVSDFQLTPEVEYNVIVEVDVAAGEERIYLNNVLIGTIPTPTLQLDGGGVHMGYTEETSTAVVNDPQYTGDLAHVAMFQGAITDATRYILYSGASGSSDPLPVWQGAAQSLRSAGAFSSQMAMADGLGGQTWEYPLEVEF